MSIKSVTDLHVRDTRVLIRVDFNVPLRSDGSVLDDRRIRLALPTINTVVDGGGIAVCMSHLGRPIGDGPEPAFSLSAVAKRLAELLGDTHPVHFVEGACRGPAAEAAIAAASPGDVVLLDNLRFEAGEKAGDAAFAKALASLGDAYVNEAFGTAHRAHASMVGVPRAMGEAGKPCVAGLLLDKELRFLSDAIKHPRRPFYAVLGGAKVSGKLLAIRNLLPLVDGVIVGGGMAYTFLAAQGQCIGNSVCETDMVETARALLAQAAGLGKTIHLPVDHVCAQSIGVDVETRICAKVPDGWMGLDIGPASAAAFAQCLNAAGTVVWNGPMGVFETPPFDAGTRIVAQALRTATLDHQAITIVGGGETAAAVDAAGVASELSHVSTGGGASLRMLEGVPFESVDCLDQVG
jgi:phosphoglycerate kinase